MSSQTHLTTDFKDYSLEIFPLRNIKKLDVRAKHATINLLNWDKDSISIETSIEILTDKPNLSKEMLKEIKVKTVSYANTLQVKTTLANDFNRTIPYKIKYNIFYPKYIVLRVENNHGGVNIGDVEGGTFANISYCDINFKNLQQETDSISNNINLLHCKGEISDLGSAIIQVKNSSVNILNANNINLTSEYSLITLDKASSLKSTSNVDNLKIGTCESITINTNNSIVGLNNFDTKGLFECTQGSLHILNTSEKFKELIINNHQTPTKIHINNNSSYTINGELLNGKFSHPQTNNIQIIKDQNNISVSGEVENSSNTNAKVIIFNRDENIVFN